MRLKIKTQVNASLKEVKDGFTQELFLTLNPPFPPVKLLQFDGCKAGDQVALELNFILFKQRWISDIITDEHVDGRWYFIDEGIKLPFFISKWRHHHEVKQMPSGGSVIIDDIYFTTGVVISDLIMYPLLYGQFLYRKPIYKRVFSGQR